MKHTICVDIDGTLAEYNGWQGINHIGTPFPSAKQFLTELQQHYKMEKEKVTRDLNVRVHPTLFEQFAKQSKILF